MIPRNNFLRGVRENFTYDPETGSSSVYSYPPEWVDRLKDVVNGTSSGGFTGVNPITFTHETISYLSGRVDIVFKPDTGRYQRITGPLGYLPTVNDLDDPEIDSNLYNQCLSELYDKIRDSTDLLVDVAQASQAVSMFRNAERYVSYVLSFKKKTLRQFAHYFGSLARNPKSVPKGIGSKWLEYQYGIKPLAQDLYGSCITLAKSVPPLLKVRAKAHSFRAVDSSIAWPGGADYIERRTGSLSKRIQMRCQFSPPAEEAQLMSNFTSLNPASLIWELQPYSFVLDWFIDIGGYIRNLETAYLFQSTYLGGFVTEGSRFDITSKVSGSVASFGNVTTVDYHGSYYRGSKNRYISAFPMPRMF